MALISLCAADSSASRCSTYFLASALMERRGWLTLVRARIARNRTADLGSGGGELISSECSRVLSSASASRSRALELRRGRVRLDTIAGVVPSSRKAPVDSRDLALGWLVLTPEEGETFSASDDAFTLAPVGVECETFRAGVGGSTAPRNPALRSCSRRVCREVPGPESGRGEVGFDASYRPSAVGSESGGGEGESMDYTELGRPESLISGLIIQNAESG